MSINCHSKNNLILGTLIVAGLLGTRCPLHCAELPIKAMVWNINPTRDVYFVSSVRRADDSVGMAYAVSVWSAEDNTVSTFPELVPQCTFEGLTDFYATGDTIYVPAKCDFRPNGDIWVSTAGAPFENVAMFDDPEGHSLWHIDSQGNLERYQMSRRSPYEWRVSTYSPHGYISEHSYSFMPDTTLSARFRGSMFYSAPLYILESGLWLFAIPCPDPQGRLSLKGKGSEFVESRIDGPNDWIAYCSIDPKTERVVGWGVDSLEDVSHGSIDGWVGYMGVQKIASDSSGIILLVEGHGLFPRYLRPGEELTTRLYLVQFDSCGRIVHPDAKDETVRLRKVTQIPSKPALCVLRHVPPELTSEHALGSYKLMEFDSKGNCATTYYDAPSR